MIRLCGWLLEVEEEEEEELRRRLTVAKFNCDEAANQIATDQRRRS